MSEKTKMSKIKPCPFCGENPHVEDWQGFEIRCESIACGVWPRVVRESEAVATAIWNHRAAERITA